MGLHDLHYRDRDRISDKMWTFGPSSGSSCNLRETRDDLLAADARRRLTRRRIFVDTCGYSGYFKFIVSDHNSQTPRLRSQCLGRRSRRPTSRRLALAHLPPGPGPWKARGGTPATIISYLITSTPVHRLRSWPRLRAGSGCNWRRVHAKRVAGQCAAARRTAGRRKAAAARAA